MLRQLNTENLGVTEEQLVKLFKAFIKYYTNPLNHKGLVLSEFEAFVVGYKLAKTLEPDECLLKE